MRDLTWVLERKTLTEDRWAAWAKLSEFTLLTKLCDSFWSRHSKASFFVERSYQRWKRYGLEVHVDLYVVIRRPTTSTISFDKNLLVVGNQGDQMFYTQCESFKPKSGLPPIKAYHKLKSCDSCNLPLRTVNTSKIFWKYNFLKCRIALLPNQIALIQGKVTPWMTHRDRSDKYEGISLMASLDFRGRFKIPFRHFKKAHRPIRLPRKMLLEGR